MSSRQQDRKQLRARAEGGLVALLGRGLPRKLRRIVGRAYANAAYRMSQELKPIRSKYAFSWGHSEVVLNGPLLDWIANGERRAAEAAKESEEARSEARGSKDVASGALGNDSIPVGDKDE